MQCTSTTPVVFEQEQPYTTPNAVEILHTNSLSAFTLPPPHSSEAALFHAVRRRHGQLCLLVPPERPQLAEPSDGLPIQCLEAGDVSNERVRERVENACVVHLKGITKKGSRRK